MASREEHYNVIIGMAFRPGGAEQQAVQTADRITNIFRRIGEVPVGGFNTQLAEQFGQQLRRSIEEAMRVDARNSPLFQSMRQVDQRAVTSTTQTDPSRFISERINLTMAELRREEVQRRSRIPIGNEGAFPSDGARTMAQLTAAGGVERANRAMTAAQERYARELEATAGEPRRQQEALGRQISATLRNTARAESQQNAEFNARGRVILAMERRAQQDETAARRQQEVLGREINAILRRTAQEENDARRSQEALGRQIIAIDRRAQQEETSARRSQEALGRQINAMLRRAQQEETSARRQQEALGRQIIAIDRRATQEQNDARRQQEARGRVILALERRAAQEQTEAQRQQEALGRQINALLRRAAADERAAEIAARAADADQVSATFTTSFPGASPDTELGRAQSRINQAELALEVANRQLTDVRQSGTRTAAGVLAAERRVEAASSALAAARDRLAITEARAGTQGVGQQFMAGFRGQSDRPYAEQIGQAFKFSIFYGTAYKLLFGITQTFQQTLQEGIAFQEALTDLRLATSGVQEDVEALGNQLGQRSVEAGFAPSQGVQIGARAVGLYGATDASAAEQARIADMSARAVSRMAFISGMQPDDLQTNAAAITNTFGSGPAGVLRVADLDAYFSKLFGVASGNTIQAVSESAAVGQAAGYSQEEVFAVASLLQGRTGQSPSAVAGYMAQIFSRGGEGSLTSVTGRYGIDPAGELSDQIAQLADVYRNASSSEQSEIAAAFGRGKVQNAVIQLLANYDEVASGAEGARTEAGGAQDRAFDLRMGDIGGQIQLTVAALQEFANVLGQSGLLEVLGAAVVVFRNIVEGGTEMLRMWAELPGAVRATVVALGLLTLAARSSAVMQGARGALGLTQVSTYGMGTGVRTAAGAAVPVASGAGARAMAGNLAGAAAGAVGAAGPMALAIGGLVAVGALAESSRRLREAQEHASAVLTSTELDPTASPDEYRARASELQVAASDQRDAAGGVRARILGGRDEALDSARALEAEASRLEQVASDIETRAAAAAAASPDAIGIASFDADGLTSSMDDITAAGGTAEDRFRALAAAIRGSADAAERANNEFSPTAFAQTNASRIRGLVGENLASARVDAQGTGDAREVNGETRLADAVSGGEMERILRERMGDIGNLGNIDPERAREIAQGIMADLAEETPMSEAIGDDLAGAEDALVQYLLSQADGVREVVDSATALTGPEVTNAVNTLVSIAEERMSNRPETDLGGRVRVARQLVRNIQATIARSADGQGTAQSAQALMNARRMLAESQIAELDQLRRVAQQNASSRAEVRRIGRASFGQQIQAAIRGNAQDALVQLVGEAGAWGRRIALDAVNDAIRVAQEALRVRQASFALWSEQLTRFTGMGPDTSAEQGEIDKLKGIREAIRGAVTGSEDNKFDLGNDLPTYEAPDTGEEKAKEDRETAAQRAAARRAAEAVRSESAITQARADVYAAQVAMRDAEKGSVAYYDALGQYYAARNSLTDAILAYRNNQFLLGRDITDPVVQAQAALRAAAAKLRSDRGKGADVQAQNRLDVRQAQADLEAQKFQQRLDSVTVAEELGRISHRAYINYLENERQRLNRIKDRSFQQQEQLNQIDQLLQDAASAMDAQWNFGDIKLPTPYEIRRRTEELYGDADEGRRRATGGFGGPGDGRPTTGDTNIHVNGADIAMVMRIMKQYLGRGARTTTTKPRHR